MTIQEYFGDWTQVVDLQQADTLLKRAVGSGDICPLPKDVFKAFHLCPLKDVRVIILGQDPYCYKRDGKPIATGIAFANHSDTPQNFISPSLDIIRDSIIDFTKPHRTINFDLSLESWEEQGVLLLNTALTCKTGAPGSHALLWKPFIEKLLTNLSKCTTGIVYVLMGNSAQTFESFINNRFNHILKEKHPAWYARNKTAMPSGIWKTVNDILTGMNGYGINWYQELNL